MRRESAARANFEWQQWGEIDPCYGVCNLPGKAASDETPWTLEELLASGEKDWLEFRTRWERYGLNPDIGLEIGCGVGRWTRPMASTFNHVHATDVSPGMIRQAAKATEGLPVTLYETDGLTLPVDSASIDGVFSSHVFQHMDSVDDALTNFGEIARVLKPGGTCFIHIPLHMWPGGLAVLQRVYDIRRRIGDWRAQMMRKRMMKGQADAPIMRGQCVDWAALEPALERMGFVDLQVLVFRIRGAQGSYVLGRRD
jgi:SAM-dependent methyltransferase